MWGIFTVLGAVFNDNWAKGGVGAVVIIAILALIAQDIAGFGGR
jgi:hypothetical protein